MSAHFSLPFSSQASTTHSGACCQHTPLSTQLSRQHRPCSTPTSSPQRHDAGNDSTRASVCTDIRDTRCVSRDHLLPRCHSHYISASQFFTPTLAFSSSSSSPCPSPRSPPPRSPAIASAAVHAHTAAHRTHATRPSPRARDRPISRCPSSPPSPSLPHPSLVVPRPRVHRRATPTPHLRAHRRVECRQHQTRARVTQLGCLGVRRVPALPCLHPHLPHLSLVSLVFTLTHPASPSFL
ncbi:hypothetical protein B0H16DRAFT_1900660, partial [Mycena metata]